MIWLLGALTHFLCLFQFSEAANTHPCTAELRAAPLKDQQDSPQKTEPETAACAEAIYFGTEPKEERKGSTGVLSNSGQLGLTPLGPHEEPCRMPSRIGIPAMRYFRSENQKSPGKTRTSVTLSESSAQQPGERNIYPPAPILRWLSCPRRCQLSRSCSLHV